MRLAIIRYADAAARVAGNGTCENIIEGGLLACRAAFGRPLVEVHPLGVATSACEPGADVTIVSRWPLANGIRRIRRARYIRSRDGAQTEYEHPDTDGDS